MRTKDEWTITAGDAAYCWGVPQNSRQFLKVLALLRPNRVRLRGEVIEFSLVELLKGGALMELLNIGFEDDLAMVTAAALPKWVGIDLRSGSSQPGILAVYADVDGDMNRAVYLPRTEQGKAFDQKDAKGRPYLSVHIIDVQVLGELLPNRLAERLPRLSKTPDQFVKEATSGKSVAEALNQHQTKFNELIESAYQK